MEYTTKTNRTIHSLYTWNHHGVRTSRTVAVLLGCSKYLWLDYSSSRATESILRFFHQRQSRWISPRLWSLCKSNGTSIKICSVTLAQHSIFVDSPLCLSIERRHRPRYPFNGLALQTQTNTHSRGWIHCWVNHNQYFFG